MQAATLQKKLLFPSLEYTDWKETLDTIHLWTQIVGKIKLKQNPFINHWWEVAFYITPSGMTTGRIPYNNIAFEITFDFINHMLSIYTNSGEIKKIKLKPMTVSQFYNDVLNALIDLKINVSINKSPSEFPDSSITFDKDTIHKSYDKKSVTKWHQIILQTSFIMDSFRSHFRGKSSPVQFFWGSFDLSTSRFSGNMLPDKKNWPKGYHFMRYAENEENFSCGFWPGSKSFPKPAFYSYMYPSPKGCESIETGPLFSYFDKNLAECIFPYEEARKMNDPKKEILNFFTTTYEQYAKLSDWDIKKLMSRIPKIK